MIETIQKILESPAGSFSFVFGIMVLAGWLIHYTTKFTTKISVEHNLLTEKTGKMEAHIDEIKKDIAFIKGAFDVVIGRNNSLSVEDEQ